MNKHTVVVDQWADSVTVTVFRHGERELQVRFAGHATIAQLQEALWHNGYRTTHMTTAGERRIVGELAAC